MTYLQFHLVFILPPIIGLFFWLRERQLNSRGRLIFLPIMAAIAFIYTTPWDNYLVWRGVWGYGTDRVIGTIGYVPVEEYLFFLLQPILTGLWLFHVLARGARKSTPHGDPRGAGRARWVGAVIYLALSTAGALMLRGDSTTYLGLILAWAGPVLAAQWAYAGQEIWRCRSTWLIGTAVPTLYLWAADAIAIRLGIWEIADRFTIGLHVWTLPLEEAVFFLVTNVLVVQGLILFLYPPGRARNSKPAMQEAGRG